MRIFIFWLVKRVIVYYVPRRIIRVITLQVIMLAGDRSRGTISPASIVASLIISRIVCIGMYSILCDFGAYTSFYAYTRIQSEKVEISVIITHLTLHFANTSGHFNFLETINEIKKETKNIGVKFQ